MPDVVVLLPGILGSVLQKDGEDLWAPTAGATFRALTGQTDLQSLALAADPEDVDDVGDGIRAVRLFPDVHLIPGLWKIDGYSHISQWLRATFDLDDQANYFEFPYDWRRSNAVAARQLAMRSRGWLAQWREHSGHADAKLVLVCHSMGGLVARHFLEVLEGWKQTKALITFGTPYRGSLKALNFLANGFKKHLGPITLLDLTAVVRSLTSVYQLLPIYPCYDAGDGKLLKLTEAIGVPNLDRTKVSEAFKFHARIANAVDGHPVETRTSRYAIHPIVGTHQVTLQSATLVDGALTVSTEYPGQDVDGDGTVPRVSATPIELGNNPHAMYAAAQHASVQNADAPLDQLSGILTGLTLDLDIFKAEPIKLTLLVDDAYLTGEPVTICVRPERPATALIATIGNVETGASIKLPMTDRGDGTHAAEQLLPPGTYRVRVAGGLAVPIADVFVVV